MVAKAGYDYLMSQRDALEYPPQKDPGQFGLDEKGVYDSENYATMYHLVGHSDKHTVKCIFSRAVKAIFLLRCLEQTSFFPALDDRPDSAEKRRVDACYIGSHILRHLQMLPCNAHEVSELGINWEEPSASPTLEIGSAIYPVLSLINHSCDPSVVRHSYADVCVVRAIRSIPAGEEIYDNYGALHPVMDYAARQKHLKKQYFFDCACEACVKNWPLYIDIPRDSVNFYCENCRGRVPVPAIANANSLDTMACLDCGKKQNIRGHILKVGSLERSFQEALHKVIFSLDVEGDALQHLVHFLRVVDKYVHRPFSSHNDCQEAIKLCYAYKGNAYPRTKRSGNRLP
nr:hypothetical protein BaRGS_012704 [Batillaria attramentaria]